ncbi:hypothetical protein IGJ28_003493 [Enterococcus sp. AZ091]
MEKKRISMGEYNLLELKTVTQGGRLIECFFDNKDRSFINKKQSRIKNESRRSESN